METLRGEEIVISGVAGCFPDAENTHVLSEKLYNKIDMVSKCHDTENIKHPELPNYAGRIKDMDKFDSQFFRVTHWQASSFDPVGRKLLEQAFSAIFDAGTNPENLRGSKLGVFIGAMQTDSGYLAIYNAFNRNGFVVSGCSKTMLANRISYWIDGKGPSFGFDQGCVGSMSALEIACNRMKSGEIDCAIVGGSNYCLIPQLNVNLKRAELLCLDGKTKCFDKNGDGYVRSDAISVYFLQKAKDAKRVYAEVFHVKGKYFAAPDGSFSINRNPKDLEKFFEEFYSEIAVSPQDVEYVEANAFGIAESDGNELEAIGKVFGKEKTIKIGSVRSNMGNTEAASGACSVTKMCLSYQNGQIPANLHCYEQQDHLSAVREGKLQVVVESEPFNRGYTAINNFCYTGGNFHALLKGHYKPKDPTRYKSNIPRLVLASGRLEESVNKIFDYFEISPYDPEHYALLNNIFKYNVPGHTGRGYAILDSNENKETISLYRSFQFYSGYTPPVWFLYSGMGSQWAGMGESLLQLPVFAAAMEGCDLVLRPYGLDIFKIMTDKDSKSLNILNSLVGITAVQIGLTDVLKSLGIVPDNIIGHSLGELGCAYADGALTAEQTILAAYSRAIVSYETKFVKGKMAAVGLGYLQVCELCPPEIQVACHNSFESATLSGPADIVTEFVKTLKEKGIFAKEVASYDIAFHSKFIAQAGPKMLKLLKKFIIEPKLRSDKWLSTCFLPEDWDKPKSKYASGEYFTHNLLSSVLFEEAARLIPDDAIIIEIAPHGLLQAIMKRSHNQCVNLSLTRRAEKDSINFLLKTIGILYENGLNPDVDGLYPKVEFPVSSETPLLSHFVGWDHTVEWASERNVIMEKSKRTTSKEFIFTIHDDEYSYLKDHVRNGINILPEAALLVFAWETLSEYKEIYKPRLAPVIFENVKFKKELIIKPEEVLKLNVTILKGSNRFEITHEDYVIADGYIMLLGKNSKTCGNITFSENVSHFNQNDIYDLSSVKGYSYGKEFQNITSTNIKRNMATIKWNDRWITFIDSLIQLNALSRNFNGISSATLINKLMINVEEHRKFRFTTTKGDSYYNAMVRKDIGNTVCPGVIFKGIVFNDVPKNESVLKVLHTHNLIGNIPSNNVDMQHPQSLSKMLYAMESTLKDKQTSVIFTDSIEKSVYKPAENNTKFNCGLEVFFNHVMENEYTASEPIVQMITKSSLSNQHELLINPEDSFVMMIPGFDGNYEALNSISERLKIPALALQLCPDINGRIPEMAKTLLNYVEKRRHLKSPFYLMGYSFGVNVALEMAALLEAKGLVGTVYCLDSSPDAMRVHLDAYLGDPTEEQLQNLLITHMFKLLVGYDSNELKDIIKKTKKWNDKLEVFNNIIKSQTTHSHQYLRSLIQAAYNRIKLAKEYKPQYVLKSKLVLIKGILHPNAEQLGDDYNLSKFTTKPVQVYEINSGHALALKDCRVSNYINRTLVP